MQNFIYYKNIHDFKHIPKIDRLEKYKANATCLKRSRPVPLKCLFGAVMPCPEEQD